jgi:hypothetical protein
MKRGDKTAFHDKFLSWVKSFADFPARVTDPANFPHPHLKKAGQMTLLFSSVAFVLSCKILRF